MKKPVVAFILSFLIPGAGLAYLGKWGWAVLNFIGACFLAGLLMAFLPPESLTVVAVCIDAGSGSLAMGLAQSINQKVKTAGAAPQAAVSEPIGVLGAPQTQFSQPPTFHGGAVASGYSNFQPPSSQSQAATPQGTARPVEAVRTAAARPKFCGECGTPIANEKFCPECGKPLRPKDICPRCGTKIQPGTKFCGECGGNLG